MNRSRLSGALLLGAAALACSTHAKEEVAKTALDAQSEPARRDTFEAMARALDDRPEDVDLFYAVAKRHPKLMDRFVDDTTADLAEEEMARLVARHLAEKPDSLEMTMKLTIEETAKRPPARRAMNRAIAAEARTVSGIMTDDTDTMAAVVGSLLDVVGEKPRARRALLGAVAKDRATVLAFAKDNPGLAKEIAEQVIREEVKDEPVLEQVLRATNIIDDDAQKGDRNAKKKP